MFGASYATEIFQLIFLQGVLYAIGGALLYLPCMSYLTEWFFVRRGTATGILFAGRVPRARVRIQGPAPRGATRPKDLMRHTLFWIYLTVNTIQGFAHFVPIVYLPSEPAFLFLAHGKSVQRRPAFASELHISPSKSAVTLAVYNAASFVVGVSMGYLSDKINAWIVAFSALLLEHPMGWFHSAACHLNSEDDPNISDTLYGYLLLSRGIGSIVSTPISAKLYAQSHNVTGGPENTGFEVGDGRFETMIIYVGTCFAGAAGVAAFGVRWTFENPSGKSRNLRELCCHPARLLADAAIVYQTCGVVVRSSHSKLPILRGRTS
ncbi:major facilitator superfamily domain-containing protein [Mycena crocata]|nr:major facilitator superfamily domain-containing protein [Mycena crocata]